MTISSYFYNLMTIISGTIFPYKHDKLDIMIYMYYKPPFTNCKTRPTPPPPPTQALLPHFVWYVSYLMMSKAYSMYQTSNKDICV